LEPNSKRVERAYRQLKEAVVAGQFEPGHALFESHLAVELKMSRTPVREALRLLASDGYIERNPARGYLVPRLTVADLYELFELRESLESLASRSAALRATDEEIGEMDRLCDAYAVAEGLEEWAELGARFHRLVVVASRNRRLATILDSLNDQIHFGRRSSLHGAEARHQDALREHRAILEAIKARDGDRAEQLARVHVRRSLDAALQGPETYSQSSLNHFNGGSQDG
jgi:DNA-binding GntR family transcriptional regulator